MALPLQRIRASFAVLALTISTIAMGPGPTLAGTSTTWQFPGSCGGAATLQHCIDDVAQAGDTIEIASDMPVSGPATITKSLTLTSGLGFDGTVTGGVHISASAGSIDVALDHIAFDGGITAQLSGGSGHHVTLDHVVVTNPTTPGVPALSFINSVDATLVARASTFNAVNGMAIQVYLEADAPGLSTYRLVGNRLDGHGNANSFGGVQLILDDGHVTADILDNVVWDVGGCGCVGGAAVYYRVNNPGSYNVDVVGNTFDRAVTGVFIQTLTTAGGQYSLDLFDNVISHPTAQGVTIDGFQVPSEFQLRAGNNDYFDLGQPNNFNGYPEGPHNLAVAPGFRDAANGDLRLKSSSPLIDKGIVCSPGGVAGVDAAGHARLRGPTVDLGAYERGALAPTGKAFVGTPEQETFKGTPGADIMCGYGGADFLDGRAGNDYLNGGASGDIVVGGSGADRLFGSGDRDSVCGRDGVSGNDRLDGGPGDDDFQADPGDVLVSVEHHGCVGIPNRAEQ